jgi:hypothetical protein
MTTNEQKRYWPLHGWCGIALVVVFWILNWSLSGLRTHWGFFPLWLGYALTVDALVFLRKGSSLLTRNPAAYAGLFLVSAPAWWLFELINLRTQNWIYLGEEAFSPYQFAALSTLSFSTVMPAVFGTAELVATCSSLRRMGPGPAVIPTPAFLRGIFVTGCTMLLLFLFWPDLFFPLIWISVYCIIEPLNVRLGNRSLLDDLARVRLDTGHRPWGGMPHLRLFLGNVEFLLLSQVGIPDTLCRLASSLRDAASGLSRLPALFSGAVCNVPSGHGTMAAGNESSVFAPD